MKGTSLIIIKVMSFLAITAIFIFRVIWEQHYIFHEKFHMFGINFQLWPESMDKAIEYSGYTICAIALLIWYFGFPKLKKQ